VTAGNSPALKYDALTLYLSDDYLTWLFAPFLLLLINSDCKNKIKYTEKQEISDF
jgi:hypothetical protein